MKTLSEKEAKLEEIKEEAEKIKKEVAAKSEQEAKDFFRHGKN